MLGFAPLGAQAIATRGIAQPARVATAAGLVQVLSEAGAAIGTAVHVSERVSVSGATAATAPLQVHGNGLIAITGATEGVVRLAAGLSLELAPTLAARGRSKTAGISDVVVSLDLAMDATTACLATSWGRVSVSRRLETKSAVSGVALRAITLEGLSRGATQMQAAIGGVVGLPSSAGAGVWVKGSVSGVIAFGGGSATNAISVGRVEALEPRVEGDAYGTVLEPRQAAAVGQLLVSSGSYVSLAVSAAAQDQVPTTLGASAQLTTRVKLTGTFGVTRDLDGNALVSGQADRPIALTGLARAITKTAADAAAIRLDLTGASEAQTASIASARHEHAVSGDADLISPVAGAAIITLGWAGASDVVVKTHTAVETEVAFQGAVFSATGADAAATDQLAIVGIADGDVDPAAHLCGHLALAGSPTGTVSSHGFGRGVFVVARDFTSDVDVFGDSARAIGLAGQATVDCATTGIVPAGDIKLVGSDAAARARLAAKVSGALALTGETTTVLAAHAEAAAILAIGCDSNAAVEIDGGAYRSITFHGSCEGQASIIAKPRPLHLALDLITNAANAADGRAGSVLTTAGSGLAQVQSRAASHARLAVSRTGAADVLILGAAWHGMPFLGAAHAQIPALAAANSPVMPSLATSAANVIHLDLEAQGLAPGGHAAGSILAGAHAISAQWELNMTAIAYRAPPALRRFEPPRLGLSGRLLPTNAGRILRG